MLNCPICDKCILKRFEDHMIKIHNFTRAEAIEIHYYQLKVQYHKESEEAKEGKKQIDEMINKKFKSKNTNLSEFE